MNKRITELDQMIADIVDHIVADPDRHYLVKGYGLLIEFSRLHQGKKVVVWSKIPHIIRTMKAASRYVLDFRESETLFAYPEYVRDYLTGRESRLTDFHFNVLKSMVSKLDILSEEEDRTYCEKYGVLVSC
jgi:hypothetical protein